MDCIIPIVPPKTILVKDLSTLFNWHEISSTINLEEWVYGNNYQISKSKNIFDKFPSEFVKLVEHESEEFLKNTFPLSFDFNLKISESWANKMSPGDAHPWHEHPFSVISGIIFLDDTEENLNLQFKNNINDHIPPYSLLNLDYFVSLRDLVNEDKTLKHHLILFYSNISHCVTEITKPRTTISFNTFWKGKVNFGSNLSSYDFK
jgi:hypothetical protein